MTAPAAAFVAAAPAAAYMAAAQPDLGRVAACTRPDAATHPRPVTVGCLNTNGLNTLKTSGLLSLLTELQAAPPLPRRHGVAPSTTPDILFVVDTHLRETEAFVGKPRGFAEFRFSSADHGILALAASSLACVHLPLTSSTPDLEILVLAVPGADPPLAIAGVYLRNGRTPQCVDAGMAELRRIDDALKREGFARWY